MRKSTAIRAFANARRKYFELYGCAYGTTCTETTPSADWPDTMTHTKRSWEKVILPRDQRRDEETQPTDPESLPY